MDIIYKYMDIGTAKRWMQNHQLFYSIPSNFANRDKNDSAFIVPTREKKKAIRNLQSVYAAKMLQNYLKKIAKRNNQPKLERKISNRILEKSEKVFSSYKPTISPFSNVKLLSLFSKILVHKPKDKERISQILNESKRYRNYLEQRFDGIFQKARDLNSFTCFTNSHSNKHMWAEFGGDGNGICVAYPSEAVIGLRKVKYKFDTKFHLGKVLPYIYSSVLCDKEAMPAQELIDAVASVSFTKKRRFKKEKEIRSMLATDLAEGFGTCLGGGKCLVEPLEKPCHVYIGKNVSPEDRELIIKEMSAQSVEYDDEKPSLVAKR